jgi:hypothetical protein
MKRVSDIFYSVKKNVAYSEITIRKNDHRHNLPVFALKKPLILHFVAAFNQINLATGILKL